MDLSFAVHKLGNFSENPVKMNFESFVHLLRYISYYNSLGLKYYADMNNAPVSDLSRQDIIETENQLIAFSYSSWQDFP